MPKNVEDELLEALQREKAEHEATKAELKKAKEELKSYKTDNSLLRAQVQVQEEDFKLERADRERAHARLVETETECESLRRRIHQHELQQMKSLSQRRQAALSFYKAEYDRKHPTMTDSVSPDVSHDLSPDGEGQDEIDSGVGMSEFFVSGEGKKFDVPVICEDDLFNKDTAKDLSRTQVKRSDELVSAVPQSDSTALAISENCQHDVVDDDGYDDVC